MNNFGELLERMVFLNELERPYHPRKTGRELFIYGKLCPFNVPNSYNEILRPNSLRDKFPQPGLPMFVQHQVRVGTWLEFTATEEGLYGHGRVDSDKVIAAIHDKSLPDFSIDFIVSKYEESREERVHQAQRIAERQLGHSMNSLPPNEVDKMLRAALPQQIITSTHLEEVSVVEKGAFSGCKIRIVK